MANTFFIRNDRSERSTRVSRKHGIKEMYLVHMRSILNHAYDEEDAERVAKLVRNNQPHWFN